MAMPMTAAELYRHGLRLLVEKDIPGWVDLWDEAGVLEFPFAPQGWPQRLEGRQAVGEYMRHYPDHVDVHDFPDVTIHQTTVPETIVVEMRGVGRLVETDSPFDMTYIAVVTVRDGRITSYRDYWNPLAVQQPGADFVGANR
ncbi:nuclear transport factor 2 family protein [Streptomyces mirabilis]|uniref:nuclear transport factor 2 family protein n=3 Tax=Streptomyces TaxID=1883 RepID=UPI001164E37F|nr:MULTISPECIES: nuclear transport factor 2 family protein [Streptomyces]MCX4426659.1 nuclear transport factor 2 family protein [Streptomyces mirabilis]QDN54900.1 nuclear transport factor 2 family protein [Streptomyces sp. S1D4-20]QDN65080.1 nuclear transport factor 2 family protein [Streptomyces sp. S1D4-14]QDO47487.1 nuclear transport factor 2 family protein [Streptomyces sp. RLB3-5]QDO57726.1 nuclear transport factor 2 family protein [Streptomyces sp. RLB1-8]